MKRPTPWPIPRAWQLIGLCACLLALVSGALPLHAQDAPHTTYLPLVAGAAPQADPAVDPAAPTQAAATRRLYLPLVQRWVAAKRNIEGVPVAGPSVDRPAAVNADLNLALRGFMRTSAPLRLVDYGGDTDGDPPQLARLFAPPRLPGLTAAYRVYDWNWNCGALGCRAAPLVAPPVTLLGMGTRVYEPIHVPARRSQIYAGGFVVLVLYADPTRITLKYTREDSPVHGYMVHIEGFSVEPWLLARYRELDAAGRRALPGLRSGDLIGYAASAEIKVAVRDTGSFMDPRSRKDWWHGW